MQLEMEYNIQLLFVILALKINEINMKDQNNQQLHTIKAH